MPEEDKKSEAKTKPDSAKISFIAPRQNNARGAAMAMGQPVGGGNVAVFQAFGGAGDFAMRM